jgi:hypothetical protein
MHWSHAIERAWANEVEDNTMGQGANITISNFSPHVLKIAVTQSDYIREVPAGLDQTLMKPKTGLRPFYIEANGITSNSYFNLSLTVMKPNGTGGYQPDAGYAVSTARMELTGDNWAAGQQTNGALTVGLEVVEFTQDLITIFLERAQ